MANQETQPQFISEHIPRTGGTSLRKFFGEVFPKDKVYFYYSGGVFTSQETSSLVMRYPFLSLVKSKLLYSNVGTRIYKFLRNFTPRQNLHQIIDTSPTIIHGHQTIRKFKNQYPQAQLITVVRDPLERAVSHYFYIDQYQHSGWAIPKWSKGINTDLPLDEFLLSEQIINFQAKAIDPHKLGDFTFIGVTEQLSHYCQLFDSSGNIPIPKINEINRPPYSIAKNVRDKFKQLNRDDYLLHESAKSKQVTTM